MPSTHELVAWMKAVGEPTRIRLLALCAERELSVTDLARTVHQSGPRVSRHLKILCAAGLLERIQQGQWVHYQLPSNDAAAKFVRSVLAQLDRADAVLARDRQHARFADVASGPAAQSGSRLGRSMRAFVESHRGPERAQSAVVIGASHMELLEAASAVATSSVAVMPSRRAAQAARAFVEEHELACKPVVATAADALKSDGAPGAVIIEHLAGAADALAPLLASARAALPADGRVWLFARYEAFEGARERIVEHPLARLRRLLSEAGLACQQLSPIEADGEHVLAATAVRAAGASLASPASVA